MARHRNIDACRMSLAFLATLLLVAGAILGHPEMSVADSCAGYHELGCTQDSQCPGLCQAFGALCTSDPKCYTAVGACECYLVDP